MGYFGSRAAPLGPVGPGVVEAAFYGFAPRMVRRAIPDAWSFAPPARIVSGSPPRRAHGRCDVSPPRSAPVTRPPSPCEGSWITQPIRDESCSPRTATLGPPDDPVENLWWLATCLREHRGDGHVAVLGAAGLDGCEAHVLFAAAAQVPDEVLRDNRGWTADEWQQATERLTRRGLLDEHGVTNAGRALRRTVEARTDELAGAALSVIDDDVEGLVRALEPTGVGHRRLRRAALPEPHGAAAARPERRLIGPIGRPQQPSGRASIDPPRCGEPGAGEWSVYVERHDRPAARCAVTSPSMIEASGLAKRYGETVALAGIDLRVPAGQILGVLGPNGAGKTTAVRILTTLAIPDAGRAEVAGYDVVAQAALVRRHIGVAAQDATLDDALTGRQNLVMIGELSNLRPAGRPGASHRAPRTLRAQRRRRPGHEGLLGRHAPTARSRRQPGHPPARPVPRRAHDRARPHQPAPGLGHHPRPGRRRRDPPADHAVPRRGRHTSPTRSSSSTTAASSRRAPPAS